MFSGVLKRRMKNRLADWWPLFYASDLRRCLRNCRASVEQRRLEHRIVSMPPAGESRGNVLFSYRIEGFLLPVGHPVLNTHTNYWRSVQMARTFLELGYTVDVIDYRNDEFEPEKEYAVFVDVRHNLERLASRVGNRCTKIFHIDTAHILRHNAGEAARLVGLQERKNVTLQPVRWERPNLGIEFADCATASVAEGEYAISTFRYAGKPIYPVPVPVAHTFDCPRDKDWQACRNRFVWFGSGGLVHKGLDVTLDAFAKTPECHLTVCAPVHHEKAFERAYWRELYKTPNIETVGWVESGGEPFRQIARSCAGLVFPSVSESCSASTIECMHAGLIPIVSRETGVPVRGFGCALAVSSVEEIQAAVRRVAGMAPAELETWSRQAWEYARTNHTRERFAAVYRDVITTILAQHTSAVIGS